MAAAPATPAAPTKARPLRFDFAAQQLREWASAAGERIQTAIGWTLHPTQQLVAAYKHLQTHGGDKDAAELLADLASHYPSCLQGTCPDLEEGNYEVDVSMLVAAWDDLATSQCGTQEEAVALVQRVEKVHMPAGFASRFFAHSKYPNAASYFVEEYPIVWFVSSLCRRGKLEEGKKTAHAKLSAEEQDMYPLKNYKKEERS